MELLRTEHNGVLVVTPEGHIDAYNAGSLKDQLKTLISEGKSRLVANMSRVGFIDSSGLGVMIVCWRSATEHDGDLRVAGLQAPVRSLFELAGLHRIFQLYDTEVAAIQSFGE